MATFKVIKGKNSVSIKAIIRRTGYKTRCKNFSKITQAKEWAKKIEVQMKEGTYKETNFDISDNLQSKFVYTKDLIIYYKNNIAPIRYSYAEKYNVIYDWWIEKIGDIKLKELSSSILSNCKQLLINEKITKKQQLVNRSNNTVNKYLMALSAILTYAYREIEVIDVNPMQKVKALKKPNGRTRFLNKDEIKLLAQACKNKGEDVYLFFLLLISTGGRYSEVLNLKTENIDKKNNRVHFLNTKNNTNRGVGINSELLQMIEDYCSKNEIDSGYIFYNKKKQKLTYIRGQLIKIINDVGLQDFHIHDLRHTFASISAENGANLLEIAILLGHKSLVMARRYSHLTQQHTDDIARNTSKNLGII